MSDQAVLARKVNGLNFRIDVKLVIDVADVRTDSIYADRALVGDHFVAQALYQSRQNLPLALGQLGVNRHWQVKCVGTYFLPWGFSVTGDLRWLSGLTWTAYLAGWEAYPYTLRPFGYLDLYLEPRGSRIGPASWYLNLNITKSISLVGRMKLDLIADIFNLFNSSYGVGVYIDPSGVYSVSKKNNFGMPNQLISPINVRLGGRLYF